MVSADAFRDSSTPRWACYDQLLEGLPERVHAVALLLLAGTEVHGGPEQAPPVLVASTCTLLSSVLLAALDRGPGLLLGARALLGFIGGHGGAGKTVVIGAALRSLVADSAELCVKRHGGPAVLRELDARLDVGEEFMPEEPEGDGMVDALISRLYAQHLVSSIRRLRSQLRSALRRIIMVSEPQHLAPEEAKHLSKNVLISGDGDAPGGRKPRVLLLLVSNVCLPYVAGSLTGALAEGLVGIGAWGRTPVRQRKETAAAALEAWVGKNRWHDAYLAPARAVLRPAGPGDDTPGFLREVSTAVARSTHPEALAVRSIRPPRVPGGRALSSPLPLRTCAPSALFARRSRRSS